MSAEETTNNNLRNIRGFSVLMSVYKNDKKDDVIAAVESIIQQTLIPDQIVIVIDGPIPDSLKEAIDSFSKSFDMMTIIQLEKNVGLGMALSEGLLHCKNEYVARMDSDDISLSTRFEKQIDYMIKHPDIDVLGGQIVEYDSKMQNPIAERRVPVDKGEIERKMKSRNAMNHVTVVYKKSAVIASGNYQHCPYFEDYYLWCRMINCGYIFHNLEDALVKVRTGEEMYQRRGGKTYIKAIIDFQKRVLNLGFINRFQYLMNLSVRLVVANAPNSLRGYIYKTKLRATKK